MKYLDIPTLARWANGAPASCTGQHRVGGLTCPRYNCLKPSPCVLPSPTPPAHRINSFLDSVDVGDLIVKGDLEAYSCEQRRRCRLPLPPPPPAVFCACLHTSPVPTCVALHGHTPGASQPHA